MQPTPSKAFNRAERLLNRWVDQKVLSPAGRDWLIEIMDPFHDTELKNLQGWPDVETGMSVVRKIKQQVSVAKPATPSFPGNYDVVIIQWPVLDTMSMRQTLTRVNNTATGVVATTLDFGGLSVYAVTPGTLFAPFAGVPTTILIGSIFLTSPYTDGNGRLIGLGFETSNTTATLAVQGSVTVFKMMQNSKDADTFFFQQTAAGPTAMFSATRLSAPPTSLADATLLQGSRTWKALEGAYTVCQFHTNENTPFVSDYNQPVIGLADDLPDGPNNGQLIIPELRAGSNVSQLTPDATHMHPIHTSGQWFSGLSASSTLQVTQIAYYESFPNQFQKDILVLATPSAEFDPVALEIYSHAMSLLPPGVMLSENPLGEWFADAVDKVASVLSYIPHPLAQGLSAIGKTAGPVIRSLTTTEANNAQPQHVTTGVQVKKRKRKNVKNNNAMLAQNVRGLKGKIEGPMRGPN